MGTRKVERGPSSERVGENIKRLRGVRRLTLDDLAARMRELGRPILKSGLSKIEGGERRVDPDDLTALAIALETNVNALLLPPAAEDNDEVLLTEGLASTSKAAWAWACGEFVSSAGRWPWARFTEHGGGPSELRRFREEVRPHDPPLYLTPEDVGRLEEWRLRLDDLMAAMTKSGLSVDDCRTVLRMASGREGPFTARTKEGDRG